MAEEPKTSRHYTTRTTEPIPVSPLQRRREPQTTHVTRSTNSLCRFATPNPRRMT